MRRAASPVEIEPAAVRLRRDFTTVLTLTKAHALLHQANRRRDQRGRIVATREDYRAVRELIVDALSQEIGKAVPAHIRETVDKVTELLGIDPNMREQREVTGFFEDGGSLRRRRKPQRPRCDGDDEGE